MDKKRRRLWLVFLFIVALLVLILLLEQQAVYVPKSADTIEFLSVQEGYGIGVFAENLGESSLSLPGPNNGVRMMEYHEGVFYVTIPKSGEVVVLEDKDHDWVIERKYTLLSGLSRPHGIAVHENFLYIAEDDRVTRIKLGQGNVASSPEKLLDLPVPKGHWTRTLKIHDDQMYISIGSTCNVCIEDDERYAAILRCTLDGAECEVFASGLRNAVDMEFFNDRLWVTDMGRDLLGNDLPPDEVNIVEKGKNYGWPFCYGDKLIDDTFEEDVIRGRNRCARTEPAFIEIPAHSAPIGLTFYEDDLLVAYHGSWNRNPPTGYKVVRFDLETKQSEDFVTGWLDEKGNVYGRPVDLLIVNDSILITDDVGGKIYRVYRE